jgi:mannan endo-1,4-beta-mannosidase
VRCLFALSSVILVVGCYDLTLKEHAGGDGGQDVKTSPGTGTGGDRGGTVNATGGTSTAGSSGASTGGTAGTSGAGGAATGGTSTAGSSGAGGASSGGTATGGTAGSSGASGGSTGTATGGAATGGASAGGTAGTSGGGGIGGAGIGGTVTAGSGGTATGGRDGGVDGRDGGGAGTGGSGSGGSVDAGSMGGTDASSQPSTMAFVTTKGTQFVEAGKRYVFVGTNFWQGMNLGAISSPSTPGDRARLGRELDRLQTLGITNVRVMAASEGPDTEPYRTVPSLMPQPGVYNEQVFVGLDYFLDQLSQRGIRAVMVLNNYWEWTGGMAQYVSWGQGTKIPYRLDTGGDYNTFTQYIDRFYACAPCQTAYRAHIQTVIQRVNTVNGRTCRDDPTIFAWQLANEPRNYPANWIGDLGQFIKLLDSNHMVTVGSEGSWGGDFKATHGSPYIDYTTCHIWVEPWGKYNATDSSASQLTTATNFAVDYLNTHNTDSASLGKPLVLEEFGLARDGWASTGKYDPATPVTNRNKYYQSLFSKVESLMAAQGAIAGDNFWAWGGEARPPSKWTGDPPHEKAGWFSVYDADQSTLTVISTHATALKKYAVALP